MSKNISTCLYYKHILYHVISLTADGETTVLRFRPEDQSSTMNCEIDGKYHPQFGMLYIFIYILYFTYEFLPFKSLWNDFKCMYLFRRYGESS